MEGKWGTERRVWNGTEGMEWNGGERKGGYGREGMEGNICRILIKIIRGAGEFIYFHLGIPIYLCNFARNYI